MDRQIELRGVRVNNLKDVDLDIPHGQFVSICGVSGSGKSSLAFDTLFAEGQRRYFESLSTYTRQFLEQLDKPEADRIDYVPPAIALRAARNLAPASVDRKRTTVSDACELSPHLEMLFAHIGQAYCPQCQTTVQQHSPDTVLEFLRSLESGVKFLVAFEMRPAATPDEWYSQIQILRSNGFRRVLIDGSTKNLEEVETNKVPGKLFVVVDRLQTSDNWSRSIDSLEAAFKYGGDAISIVWSSHSKNTGTVLLVDGNDWQFKTFFRDLTCTNCQRTLTPPEPALFSSTNPMGACEACHGLGTVKNLDMRRVVPDDSKTICQGAIVPWNSPAYEHEKSELMQLAKDYQIDVDCPFRDLPQSRIELIWNGVPERQFGGLNGFFAWLEKRKYKVQIAAFLDRWKSAKPCPTCKGCKLNSDALAFRIGGKNYFEFNALETTEAIDFFETNDFPEHQMAIAGKLMRRIEAKLCFLQDVGLGYLPLDRLVHTLSSGERQRVMLAKILGSSLTSMLYVLDEPTSGLHCDEINRLVQSVRRLCERGNTVVVVDHHEEMILGSDRIIEVGPGAGDVGGEVVFDGNHDEILASESTVTGHFLKRHSGLRPPKKPFRKPRDWIRLQGATGNNLQSVSCEIPLNCLCVVSGKSGAGKSSLISDTIYPAVCQTKGDATKAGLPFKSLTGANRVSEIVLVDQSAIGRSSRSNPVTYIKAFDEIRKTFADTVDAKLRNFKSGHFSFNVAGGRCEKCKGCGQLTIDMQFMSDVHIRCDQCQGKRFCSSVLDVKYRARNIDDVLNMTAREAFAFFRGKKKVQTKLKALIDVGLDYVRLGQPANTLSSGEAQRLKLAHFLNAPTTKQVLFVMDEPSFGLHMKDVQKLVECFDTLIGAGHSLLVIEQNLHLLKHADWIIDMGPGAAKDGGKIIATGTPDQIANHHGSVTGRHLNALLIAEAQSLQAIEQTN